MGKASRKIRDRRVRGAGRSGVLLPHGVAHTFWNPAKDPARYLIIARPKTVALLQTLHQPRGPQSIPIKELFAKFNVDLLE